MKKQSPSEFCANYEPKKIRVYIPQNWSVRVRDYHEFRSILDQFQEIGLNVDYEEVGCHGDYEAIFWIGGPSKKPKKLIEMAKKTYLE